MVAFQDFTADLICYCYSRTVKVSFKQLSYTTNSVSVGTIDFSKGVTVLTEVIPEVHLTTQGSDFDDCLPQEVVRFAGELLADFRLQVVVFIPVKGDILIRNSARGFCL